MIFSVHPTLCMIFHTPTCFTLDVFIFPCISTLCTCYFFICIPCAACFEWPITRWCSFRFVPVGFASPANTVQSKHVLTFACFNHSTFQIVWDMLLKIQRRQQHFVFHWARKSYKLYIIRIRSSLSDQSSERCTMIGDYTTATII